jgi:hypothetical protein
MKKTYLQILTEQFEKQLPVGKHNNIPDSEFDKDELKKGISVEHEHSNDPNICKAIAKDHLSEIPGTGKGDGYYSLLEKMEKEGKKESK